MLFVLPATSAIHPTPHFTPQPYEYYPSQGYYTSDGAPQSTTPSYPSHLDFYRRPSAEELEQREYERALEVVVNHRRRQAEKEAVVRRQQLAEAARQRYFAALAAELQRRQEELLAARRAELIRSQQARARLAAAERQHILRAFLQQPKGPQPLTRQPHVLKRKPLVDVLRQRLSVESDADITQPIKNILCALEPRPVGPEERKAPSEDASKLEDVLSSIFPGLDFRTQSEPPHSTKLQPGVPDKGKGKARPVDVEVPQKPEMRPESAEEAFADILRHVMGISKSAPAPQSPDESGPSGSPSPSRTESTVTESEQAQIDRSVALSAVERVQTTLTKLQADFVFPTELDHYTPSNDERDETASVSSVSSSDLTKFIPYTRTNKLVYKFENELQGLLEELDRIDSHGDAEIREKRRAVVKAVEKALEGVEQVVGEAVEKRLSLVSAAAVPEESLKAFDVDDDVTEEVIPTQGQDDAPVAVNIDAVPEPPTPVLASSPVDELLPESETRTVPEATADLPVEQTSRTSDVEASTATIIPDSVNIEAEPTAGLQVRFDATEIVDTFLLPEKLSPPSPVQQIDGDAEDEVLSLDSDAEGSDWSEVEH